MTCKSYDIPKTLIWEAWLQVKANQGAAGIDAATIERFETKLAANLYKLWNRMSSGSYFPPPVKAVPIPKKSGGVRVLGVPTVSDRIAQTAVKMWLEGQLQGTPQGGVVSPILANLFLHYAFDLWVTRHLPGVRFARYADDAVLHCKSRRQAEYVLGVRPRSQS